MHYLSVTILNVSYAVRRSQCILIFQQFLNTKEEVSGKRDRAGACLSHSLKNQCEPEPGVKAVPIKYTPITLLNLLTFLLSTPVR